MKSRERYLLGDDERAAERLGLLAELYEPSLVEFVRRFAPVEVRSLADLGCGPGYTTQALARVFPSATPIGIDNSPSFIELARRLDARNAYIVSDAAGVLPIAAQDLVYARFLLTHFADPRAALSAWSDVLAPHGRLLIQEPALLDSEHPILTRYYELLAELHRAHGQALYVGRELDRRVDDSIYALVHFGRRDFDLPAPKMARLHALNLPNWRTDSLARALFDPRELDDLESELGAIARSDAGVVHYGLGELVLERR